MPKDESEDDQTENRSLLAIEQTDKYDFLALVTITEPDEMENSCQTQESILALMAGSGLEEEEQDKQNLEVVKFYTNLTILEGNVITSTVNGVELAFNHIRLGEILKIPTNNELAEGHRLHEACFRDLGIAHALENMEPIDWSSLMIKHMARIVDPQPGSHQLAYGNLLSIVFKEFFVTLDEGRSLTRADIVTK
ncbi:hypothetical protein H5410_061556 [Solanum commersonii]|uniref:Uncharacterized protein n=1 Tax=Solanum commersonii TaxID=4109 RepID=A0A9J5WA00_SOLCO|nr:hypothetical protein H5410_061556 [Solanum commersonii]